MPSWVSEGSVRKYHRALAQLIKEKTPITDEAVKELYVKWGGLVIGDDASVQGNDNPGMVMEVAAEEVKVKRAKKTK